MFVHATSENKMDWHEREQNLYISLKIKITISLINFYCISPQKLQNHILWNVSFFFLMLLDLTWLNEKHCSLFQTSSQQQSISIESNYHSLSVRHLFSPSCVCNLFLWHSLFKDVNTAGNERRPHFKIATCLNETWNRLLVTFSNWVAGNL